jgi:hypothetical protein
VIGGAVALSVALLIQVVPYGWEHSNPPVTQDAPWPSVSARAIAVTACYDCHSNETNWPWYSYLAPSSWLVRRDVEAGRDELNFSEWSREQEGADDAIEVVLDGSMPPSQYKLLHPGARLSDAERQELVDALRAMGLADDGNRGRGRGRGGDD